MKSLIISALAFFMAQAFLLGTGCKSNSDESNIRINRAPGPLPHIIFACELNTDKLQKLLANANVIPDLKSLHAGISLSLPEYSPERAQVVRQLNQAGIPVDAWLTLPPEEGYYFNANNALQSAQRFADFEKWTAKYNLKWAGVGLDIEPGLNEFASIQKGSKLKLIFNLAGRSASKAQARRSQHALEAYSSLIRKIRSHGYQVQTYQLLFMADERKAHSTILDRVFGIVPAKGDMEALMVYSSFNHVGPALVYSYGPEAQVIAIGSTNGSDDPAVNARFKPLNWDEFSKDLVTASHFTHVIAIYSLEGCVQQGFLLRLKTFDWNQTVVISAKSINKVAHFRRVVQIVIWALTNLIYIVIGIILILVFILWLLWRLFNRLINRRRNKRMELS
jgi:hypothetical protein